MDSVSVELVWHREVLLRVCIRSLNYTLFNLRWVLVWIRLKALVAALRGSFIEDLKRQGGPKEASLYPEQIHYKAENISGAEEWMLQFESLILNAPVVKQVVNAAQTETNFTADAPETVLDIFLHVLGLIEYELKGHENWGKRLSELLGDCNFVVVNHLYNLVL